MSELKYGGVPKEEQETVIRLDAQTQTVFVNSTWAEWSRKLERLYGAPTKFQERDGFVTSAFWQLPLKAVSLRKVLTPEQRQRMANRLTPEQRQRLADRLKIARSTRRSA